MALAVVDACFLINWARFRQRLDLFRLFKRLAAPAPVFVEVRSEPHLPCSQLTGYKEADASVEAGFMLTYNVAPYISTSSLICLRAGL